MKLFNRNFNLVVIGQIISLFGNGILRFALPLFLLDETGSSAVFGAVMACSFIPMVLLSPVGGILADRVNKRNIMVALDFVTGILTVLFLLSVKAVSPVVLVTIILMLLSGIQSVYQPAVQASMPLLQREEHLMQANAIINQVASLAGLLGPVIGGMVYGTWGVLPVVVVGGICFFFSAVMELFIHMPHCPLERKDTIAATVKADFMESFAFVKKEQPIIQKVIVIIAMFNLCLTSMLIVGIPVLIRMHLRLSSELLGTTQGIGAVGGLLGGVLTGVLANKLRIQKSWKILLVTALAIFPMGMIFLVPVPAMAAYVVITACNGVMMLCATMFSVQMLVFVQTKTPAHLIGKVIAVTMSVSMCAQPVGQALYGILFDWFSLTPHWILMGSTLITVIIVLASKRVFYAVPN